MSREFQLFKAVYIGDPLSETFYHLGSNHIRLFGGFVHFVHMILVRLGVIVPQQREEFLVLHNIGRNKALRVEDRACDSYFCCSHSIHELKLMEKLNELA